MLRAARRGGPRRRRLDVGELAFALRGRDAGRAARRPREQQGGRAPPARRAEVGALVVLDSLEEIERARAAGVRRFLVRVTPGHRGRHARGGQDRASRLEVRPAAGRRARGAPARSPDCEGLHVHVGSQLTALRRVARDGRLARRPSSRALRAELGWDAAHRRPRRRARRAARRRRSRASRSATSSAACSSELERAWRRARPAAAAARSSSRADRSSRAPASRSTPSASSSRSARRRRYVDGRRRHVRQPAAGALRRALHRAAREPGRRGRRPTRTRSPASTASRATC